VHNVLPDFEYVLLVALVVVVVVVVVAAVAAVVVVVEIAVAATLAIVVVAAVAEKELQQPIMLTLCNAVSHVFIIKYFLTDTLL
jgi:hypothetical protein